MASPDTIIWLIVDYHALEGQGPRGSHSAYAPDGAWVLTSFLRHLLLFTDALVWMSLH